MLISVVVTASIAAIIIGVFCVKAVRLDRCKRKVKSYLLVPCFKDEQELERLVKSLYWDEVFASCESHSSILLLTDKNETASQKAAELSNELDGVTALRIDELVGFLKNEGGS